MLPSPHRAADEHVAWRSSAPFIAANLLPLAAVFTGVDRRTLVLAFALYVVRMVAITAGYHRYFAHRTYRLARVPQFILAFVCTTAVQKGPLWWAANHRDHHRYSDTDLDPHSPQKGFWWSHIGWVLSGKHSKTNYEAIEDFARFPELRFLNKHDWVGPWLLGAGCFAFAGWRGLVVGFFWSTVVLWHVTFSINSFMHLFGRRKYATTDTSRNTFLLAVLTMGEGWHNNHHHYANSTRQGFRWWEVDVTYYVLRLASFVGIVRGIRQPPAAVKGQRLIANGHPDVGMIRRDLARAAARLDGGEWVVPPAVCRGLQAEVGDIADRVVAEARKARRGGDPAVLGGQAGTPASDHDPDDLATLAD